MGTTFREANENIRNQIAEVQAKHHKELSETSTTIGAVIATRESKRDGHTCALRDKGVDIQAKIQITSLQDRVRGLPDAKLVIDDYSWGRLSRTRQDALIDHMLEHLAVVHKRPTKSNAYDSGVKYDDHGRPCLKIRSYDFLIRGFESTASRGGEASVEAAMFRSFQESYGQLLLFDPAKFTKAVADRETFSNPCRRRHHATCKMEGCGCPCHGQTAAPPVDTDFKEVGEYEQNQRD